MMPNHVQENKQNVKTENYNPIHHNQLVFHQNTFSKLFLALFFPLNLLFGFTFSIKSSKQDNELQLSHSFFYVFVFTLLNKAGSFQIGREKKILLIPCPLELEIWNTSMRNQGSTKLSPISVNKNSYLYMNSNVEFQTDQTPILLSRIYHFPFE